MKNGKIVDSEGTTKWYKDDKLHDEDDPAYENHEMRIKAWFLNGIQYKEEEFKEWVAKNNLMKKLENNLAEKSTEKKVKI